MKFILNNIIKNPERERLEEIYKTDRELAGIVARNNPMSAYSSEVVIIDWEDGAITLRTQNSFFCVSRTNKAYFKRKVTAELVIRSNKIWYKFGNSVKPAHWSFIAHITDFKNFLLNKFSWMRFIAENSELHYLPFNSVIRHKLYSHSDCIKYIYKCNLPISKLLVENHINSKEWKYFLLTKTLINIENLNAEFLQSNNNQLFADAIKMADILRKKINCGWSISRLKQEHDTWSKEITEIVASASNRPLRIAPEFRKILEVYPDAKLIEDTKSLAFEGQNQKHCVASYSNNIDSGRCAIFHVKGYTMELAISGGRYVIRQFKGLRNVEAPRELKDEVIKALSVIQPTQEEDYIYHFKKQNYDYKKVKTTREKTTR